MKGAPSELFALHHKPTDITCTPEKQRKKRRKKPGHAPRSSSCQHPRAYEWELDQKSQKQEEEEEEEEEGGNHPGMMRGVKIKKDGSSCLTAGKLLRLTADETETSCTRARLQDL
ncbi:hypothetical protein NQZ68_034709 [Dissostichus eleginoides]|nr:hypothetical protein NQZ68_034709 [Dissostichus eleginoides]